MTLTYDIIIQYSGTVKDLGRFWLPMVSSYFLTKALGDLEILLVYALNIDLALRIDNVDVTIQEKMFKIDEIITEATFMIDRTKLFSKYFTGLAEPLHQLELTAEFLSNLLNLKICSNTDCPILDGLLGEDRFQPSSRLKNAIEAISEARVVLTGYFTSLVTDQMNADIQGMIGECIKLGIFIFILLTFVCLAMYHTRKEAVRLTVRFDNVLESYHESCNAIYRLLPEAVAKKINRGERIKPEFFNNVTCLFADIVGFTSICSRLSANEVLSMLNSIYKVFDANTKAQKCYKVETIGDAYVAAGGVPNRSNAHAAVVANLAISLVEEVKIIIVPRRVGKLRIRVGICSGPVIAGIVGLKMPRYCLFGSTILNANRLESISHRKSFTQFPSIGNNQFP